MAIDACGAALADLMVVVIALIVLTRQMALRADGIAVGTKSGAVWIMAIAAGLLNPVECRSSIVVVFGFRNRRFFFFPGRVG